MTGPREIDWPGRLQAGAVVVREHLQPTPLVPVDLPGFTAPAYLKLESLQPTGSFKVRGALAAVAACRREGRPVVTASAGNHGLGMAFAAARLGVDVTVVVAETASTAKVAALRRFDIDLRQIGSSYDDAEAAALRLVEETGARFVSAYTDPDVIAGQATVAAEIADQLGDQFGSSVRIVVPVGGGGLAVGCALGAAAGTSVVGVEASASRAVSAAMRAGRIVAVEVASTVADGVAGNLADDAMTPRLLADHAVTITTAEETDIHAAIRRLALHHGLVVEGSGAVGIAAASAGRIHADRPCVFVITGRNIAADRLLAILGPSPVREAG